MMSSEQVRTILENCRPGGADRDDSQVREALAQVERDPELARWYSDLHAFDLSVADSFQSIPVPAGLRHTLLAGRPGSNVVHRPASWWRPAWNGWQIRAAAAAAIVLVIATVTGAFSSHQPVRFADFRRELIEESWNQSHLAYRSPDILRRLERDPTNGREPP